MRLISWFLLRGRGAVMAGQIYTLFIHMLKGWVLRHSYCIMSFRDEYAVLASIQHVMVPVLPACFHDKCGTSTYQAHLLPHMLLTRGCWTRRKTPNSKSSLAFKNLKSALSVLIDESKARKNLAVATSLAAATSTLSAGGMAAPGLQSRSSMVSVSRPSEASGPLCTTAIAAALSHAAGECGEMAEPEVEQPHAVRALVKFRSMKSAQGSPTLSPASSVALENNALDESVGAGGSTFAAAAGRFQETVRRRIKRSTTFNMDSANLNQGSASSSAAPSRCAALHLSLCCCQRLSNTSYLDAWPSCMHGVLVHEQFASMYVMMPL